MSGTNPTEETRLLAQSHGLTFKDCGNGHIKVSNHGVSVSYWPNSKRRTVYCESDGERQAHCSPWDVIQLCLVKAKNGMRPRIAKEAKKRPHNKPEVSLKPIHTNPAGIRHLYDGAVPPWEIEGDFIMAASDLLRIEAHELQVKADRMDYSEEEINDAA